MKIEEFVSSKTLSQHFVGRKLLPTLSAVLVLGALYMVFTVVPSEKVMGPVQRIFYFHVSSAIATYAMIAAVFLGSVFFLVSKKWQWDLVSQAAAEVGFAFCTIVLVTGSIWGHSAWNTWWRWEPRLVSFLVLWLMFFSYVVLHLYSANSEKLSAFRSVLGVIIALQVPIVVFSIKLLDHAQQLHPQVMASQGLKDGRYTTAFSLTAVALIVCSLWFCWARLTTLVVSRRVRQYSQALQLEEK